MKFSHTALLICALVAGAWSSPAGIAAPDSVSVKEKPKIPPVVHSAKGARSTGVEGP